MSRRPRIALTGGIACGKSLLSSYLNALGVETLDADGIVHELVPADERRRLAKIVFNDPAARRELESRLHPLVKSRLDAWLDAPQARTRSEKIRVAVVPLLFEVHWDADYDIILCVASSREKQIERMTATRGYTREEALARLAAQMDLPRKAAKSHYVIRNDGTPADLEREARLLVSWLANRVKTASPEGN